MPFAVLGTKVTLDATDVLMDDQVGLHGRNASIGEKLFPPVN